MASILTIEIPTQNENFNLLIYLKRKNDLSDQFLMKVCLLLFILSTYSNKCRSKYISSSAVNMKKIVAYFLFGHIQIFIIFFSNRY